MKDGTVDVAIIVFPLANYLKGFSILNFHYFIVNCFCLLYFSIMQIYLLDTFVFYTLVSAVWGFLLGARDRLGEVRYVFCFNEGVAIWATKHYTIFFLVRIGC